MKYFLKLILVALLFTSLQGYAQAPQGINYQGVARGLDGQPLAQKDISIRISILNQSASGPVEYEEVHDLKTNAFGLFTLVIGQGTPGSTDFSFIGWTSGQKWLQIELDENGGRNFKLMGSQQLMSVPYALYAERSGNGYQAGQGIKISNNMISNDGDGDNDSSNELISTVTLGADNKLRITDAGGTKETDLSSLLGASQDLSNVLAEGNSAGNSTITNLAAPLNASDAATKGYVDAHEDDDASATNEIQNLSEVLGQGSDAGGQKITNLGAPTSNSDATTKLYVDNLASADGDKSVTNEIQNLAEVLAQSNNAGGTKITNLGDPTLAADAATKAYVDAHSDADASPTNEIQDLSLAGNTLSLSGDATAVNLAPYLDNTDSQNLSNVLGVGNNAGGLKIENLGTPLVSTDAATKAYVDAHADGDASPTNEIQNLSSIVSGTNRTINISGGSGTTIDIADNDNNSTNESQSLTRSGSNLTLSQVSGTGGGVVSIDDADANPTNEAQTISRVGSNVTMTPVGITGGGSFSVNDNDADPANEIQNLTNIVSGTNRTINISGGSGTTIDVADNDNNPTNEIQDLSLSGNTLILSGDATTVNLTPYLDNTDAQSLSYNSGLKQLSILNGNTVTIPETQNLDQVLTVNNNAGAKAITNLANPLNAQDAATKSYVDAADATFAMNYAFKATFNYTNATGSIVNDQTMPLSIGANDFDGPPVVLNATSFTAPGDGTYIFYIEGFYNTGIAGGSLNLFFQGVKYPITIVLPFGATQPRFSGTFMFKLLAGQNISLVGDMIAIGAQFNGKFFGNKL